VKEKKIEYEPDEFLDFLSSSSQNEIVIFDVREKEDFESGSLPGAIWINPELLNEKEKIFIKTFKPYKKKKLFFLCYTGRTSYCFVLRLRKFGFLAFNLSKPKELLSKIKWKLKKALV